MERERTLSAGTAGLLAAAGFARHFAPRRWGGTAGSFAEVVEAVAVVSERCVSTGWCAALHAAHSRLAGHLPEGAQADLWRGGPDVPLSAALTPPAGRLEPVPGGWSLTGRWDFVSGVDHARWVLLGTSEATATADGPPLPYVVVVPREDVRVQDTWHNQGLRATGSHSVDVEGAFVPTHRAVPRVVMETGLPEAEAERCHRLPFRAVASLLFAAPALGAARGALGVWTELMAAKRFPGGGPALADPAVSQTLARSAGEIDAAQLLLERAARAADDAPLGALPVARNARDGALATDLLVTAVERLFRTAGAHAHAESHSLQRFWRDLHAVASHAALGLAPAAAVYAEAVRAGVTAGATSTA